MALDVDSHLQVLSRKLASKEYSGEHADRFVAEHPYAHGAVGALVGATGGGALASIFGDPTNPRHLLMGAVPGALVGAPLFYRNARRLKRGFEDEAAASKKKTAEEHKLQGHLEHQGLHIAVENRKGSVRKGVDKDGKPWRTVMKHPYGYIKGTKGADGEEVDAYVGPVKDAPDAYVVHQHKEDGKGFDEDKVMLGFKNEEEARKAYLKHYDDPKFLGPISKVPIERLQELVEEGKPLKKISMAACLEELARPSTWSDS